MKREIQIALVALAVSSALASAGQSGDTASPRHITLQEAIQLALTSNHNVRIAGYDVEEKQHAKEIAKSGYFPTLRNESLLGHITDLQTVEIPAGSLGTVAGSSIPNQTTTLFQGGLTFETSGTQLTQSLTSFLKVKPANAGAQADLKASREKAQQIENDVALAVHQLYYRVLIAQVHRSATEAKIKASQDLESERPAGEIR